MVPAPKAAADEVFQFRPAFQQMRSRLQERWSTSLVVLGALCSSLPCDAKTIWEVGKDQGHIDIYQELPTPQEFYTKFVRDKGGQFGKIGRPALFKGAAKQMPAYKLWTDDYLKQKHGKVKMDQVETEKKETRGKLPFEDWTLGKFLDRYNASDIYSTAQTPKGISDEVYLLPPMNCGGFTKRLGSTVLWFSSGGTKSVIHNDGQQNFHCIFDGGKDWVLWEPTAPIGTRELGWINGEEEAKRDPKFKDTYGTFAGLVDPDNMDTEKFPGWEELRWWRLHMEAGDCAYLPPKWYHFVESPPHRSVTVHVWFDAAAKFDQKSCEALEADGYTLSDYLYRIGDCSWGHEQGSRKATKCRLKEPLSPEGVPRKTKTSAATPTSAEL
mmetsp:Transcript_35179/g.74867  ORF Transcript_35179/g.74867 Transcript_35179/m.74867 type:complete len:383 (+) Transcript_35179:89-1237(+)